MRRPQGSTGVAHAEQRKLMLFSDSMTSKPLGIVSTCTFHEYASTVESRASPVLRQRGHLRFSTQRSRAVLDNAPAMDPVQTVDHRINTHPSSTYRATPA